MFSFFSFWQAGYEGADHINTTGKKLSMNVLNNHNNKCDSDYASLLLFDIHTVRESIGWRLFEINPDETFKIINAKMKAALKYGIQINWSLCHYGWPENLSLFSTDFVPRFSSFCQCIAAFLSKYYDEAPIYSPINEISFMSWGISVGLFGNDKNQDPNEVKRQLIRATISGCEAILFADPRARFLHCDPLIQVFADEKNEDCYHRTNEINASQFQAWDMIAGLREPELGGKIHYLDIVGANYYHSNQWFTFSGQRLEWHLGDTRILPLHNMLSDLSNRYQRPILIAETSHVGSGRAAWLNYITAQIAQAQINGCDIRGICLYPILDSPIWENIQHWPHSGLWEVNSNFARTLNSIYADTLKQSQRSLTLFQKFLIPTNKKQEYVMKQPILVVFSHLRWKSVFQRPQHIMSRLAQYYNILFIEEPIFKKGKPSLSHYQPAPNVTVFEPYTNIEFPGFHDSQIEVLNPLLTQLINNNEEPLVWFYTPMAYPLINCFQPKAIIYDCMDELSDFKLAPYQLKKLESKLLNCADIVFTGGSSLYESKKNYHPHVYCFPSSVDPAHFEQALDRNNSHPLQKHLPKPRLGYYGVIDERMDMNLIDTLSQSHLDWQIIMVGPILKIDPNILPKRNNLHWLGQQPYAALPHFLAGWDVCLIPFALNQSTKFISPTKVLEYMAAHLPIVSTAITDVMRHYGNIINIASSHEAFIQACESSLTLTVEKRHRLAMKMALIIANTSWDKTVEQMQKHLSNLYSIKDMDTI